MDRASINNFLRIYMMVVAFAAIATLILLPGLGIKKSDNIIFQILDIFIIGSFLLNSAIRLIIAKSWLKHLQKNPVEYILVFLFITQLLIIRLIFNDSSFQYILSSLNITSLTKVYIIFMQAFILLSLLSELGRANNKVFNLPLSPTAIFVLSFLLVIAVGSMLLMLPGAKINPQKQKPLDVTFYHEMEEPDFRLESSAPDDVYEKPISYIDALFTATSATCVTGLIVVPTGSYYSRFGQMVILIMIQLGGLGLMTFATFFTIVLRREFGLRHRVLLGDILDYEVFSKIKTMLTGIILVTFIFEAIGAILIYLSIAGHIAHGNDIFFSIFHSISAFCNAGFSTIDENLEPLQFNMNINLIIMGLIIFGGLGFFVVFDILKFIKNLPKEYNLKKNKFSLQTKTVVMTSLFLIVIGAVVIFAQDGGGNFLGRTFGEKVVGAFFHSVTTRTAGFNTIPISSFAPASIFFMIILMFIGASPGSTGGGIKTTTFASLYALLRARIMGKNDVPLFNRSLPMDVIRDAGLIVVLAIAVVLIGTTVLLITENGSDFDFLHLLFEEVSAFGTVGLSCGITNQLSAAGKLVIIITMFVGRIGPLTFLLAMSGRRIKKREHNLEEKIMIG
ncbi:MAG: TrkH family potassium uptake protein [Candidatus Zixiibacteriota bacterium]